MTACRKLGYAESVRRNVPPDLPYIWATALLECLPLELTLLESWHGEKVARGSEQIFVNAFNTPAPAWATVQGFS